MLIKIKSLKREVKDIILDLPFGYIKAFIIYGISLFNNQINFYKYCILYKAFL